MNDPQIWTLIAVFVGLQALVLRQIAVVESKVESQIGAVESKVGAVESKVEAQIGGLREEMRARFDQVDRRFEHLESTMTARFDHEAEVMSIRFGALEQRVAALDDDMTR